jgi:cobalt-zinc-cadmium efflux system membrane fusion protein
MANSTKNRYYLLASAAAAIAAITLWNPDHDAQTPDDDDHHEHEEFVALTLEQREYAGIHTESVRSGHLQNTITTHGKIVLDGNHVAHVIPKITGIVKAVNKNEGEDVTEGETLLVLESREIAEAKSGYLGALKKEVIALQRLEIEQELKSKNMTSVQDYQEALREAGIVQTELELARQKLYALGLNGHEIDAIESDTPDHLRFYEIKSPLSGIVLHRHATLGEQLTSDSEAFIVANLDHLWVEIYGYPKDQTYIRKGVHVKLKALDGKEGKAEIVYLNPVIDEDTKKTKAIAVLKNGDHTWNPGSYVTIEVKADKEAAPLVVHKDSVQNIEGEDCVFVEAENGFEIRPVQTGRCDSKHIEILSGVSKGEKIASTNTFLLKADHLKNEAEHEH